MNGQGFIGSSQESTRDAQMPMEWGLDLNLPPPEQNIDLNDTFVGTSAPEMLARVQPQVIDDEISIISPMVFSEARENRLRKQQGTQLINENMGVQLRSGYGPMSNNEDMEVHSSYGPMQLAGAQSGFGPMSNEDMEVHSSYDQMQLAGDMHVYHGYVNSEWTHPSSDICQNMQVMETVEEKEVSPEEVAPVMGPLKCPICISPLLEATSTRCGHVFCKACIEAAIKAQHKCPTCRRKLKKNDIIRIYLPTASA